MSETDPLWYKDAVIYQLHVKAFFDSNDDGVGDFNGLTAKLDYLQDLGVTALWLLPFYPSPLRDDGYDIADYRDINPRYGNMADFRRFVKEAHKRGLKVITELVVNHTSDQHPWFQRARLAKKGSKHRDFYVWSDTDQKYLGTRIIFLDSEKSNWTWDPVAQQYFWHRFYSHQPDLNFDNPAVVSAVTDVMRFWLDMGVDGMRLDAVPYLCEREGTNNENLPESHAILKQLRAEMDAHYEGRMLLAEANQWPEDVLPYFGDGEGDECHMAFHFPLMPRLYMAVAQEDRHPITDIMRQTPNIPHACQWAVFLRNHDELTLEMVTDRERDYLWNTYASDKRARINLGIRRRLSPLMENDRRRIDLLNALLLSMPGTPVLYYGDEIGMGDNVYLGDRDGVRTPMQWSLDRNGGFSRADPARLFLPAIQDAVYGYQAVNVEAQSRLGTSVLNTARRMIAVRRTAKSFGRGELSFLYPANRKVLAYVRSLDGEVILCVFNLSRSAQSVELDLSAWRGRIPIEMLGRSFFPAVADRPYHLTLQPHTFFWFALADPETLENGPATVSEAQPLPELFTLVMPKGWADLVAGQETKAISRDILPAFLPNQRWFGAKDKRIVEVRIAGSADLPLAGVAEDAKDADGLCLTLVETSFADGTSLRNLLPLGLLWGPPTMEARQAVLSQTLAQIRRFRAEGVVFDAMGQESTALTLLDAIRTKRSVPFRGGGSVRFVQSSAFDEHPAPDEPTVRSLGAEQSNSSVLIDDYAVLKLYRTIQPGINPEVEMARFLTDIAGYQGTPPLLGTIELADDAADAAALGVMTGFVRNQGDAWGFVQDYLKRSFDDARLIEPRQSSDEQTHDPHEFFMTLMGRLGQRTAELHRALCVPESAADPAFAPEPATAADFEDWRRTITAEADGTLRALEAQLSAADTIDDATASLARRLIELRETVHGRIDRLTSGGIEAVKTRFHGDYHLGQVLVVQNDFVIIDFEGEPRRTIEERRRKHSPLKDVAGMVRSLDYAAWAAIKAVLEATSSERPALVRFCLDWRDRATEAFLATYRKVMDGAASWPASPQSEQALLDALLIEKAFYEVAYELANRPNWLSIPIEGLVDLLTGPQE